MTDRYKDKRALVVDNGLFVHIARKLAESFGAVDYWTPSVNAFPKSNLALPGSGIEGVNRVIDFWPHARRADLIVFSDVMFADIMEQCELIGLRCYGAGWGELLELKRWYFKKQLLALNMPIAETHLLTGMAQLRRFLRKHDDFWVKTSRFRGDFETFRAKTYDEVRPRLKQLESAAELGDKADIYPFIVEKHIPAVIECGYDGDSINGKFPEDEDLAVFGIEQKDLGYVGICKPYGDFPEPVRWANRKLADILRQHGYHGLYSSELRCANADSVRRDPPKQFEDCPMLWNLGEMVPGTEFLAFYTDACCRAASPPSELYIEWITNWADKMWRGAKGEYVANIVRRKYGVEIMLHSGWADSHWQPVVFPPEYEHYVKLRNHYHREGVHFAVPQSVGLPEIGAAIGMGNTLPKAIFNALVVANNVSGYFIEPRIEAVSKTIEEIRAAQERGLEFTDDDLPTPNEIEELQELAEAEAELELEEEEIGERPHIPIEQYEAESTVTGTGFGPTIIAPPAPVTVIVGEGAGEKIIGEGGEEIAPEQPVQPPSDQ